MTDPVFMTVYFAILAVLGFYGSHRFMMSHLYRKNRNNRPKPAGHFEQLPKVTIQLPMFNEQYVAERLIDAVCEIRYPRELLEIQVLDDSTDETVDIVRRVVEAKAAEGHNIKYLHRTDRSGYKAGALEEGLKVAEGEFVAVFDADFVPTPDFLEKTIHHFFDENVGMVQQRWDHINRDFSLLTQVQSILLDGHFVIEHTARHRSGRFFNFNGTAGIWRLSTIIDAGGWQHDTLTEDLDLSYRAQSNGWQFVYLFDDVSPAEIPVEMAAFKSQQHRWAKGSIQVALKLLPNLLKRKLSRKIKLEAFMHLTNNIAYVLLVFLVLLMPLTTLVRLKYHWAISLFFDLPIFFSATFSIASFYMLAQRESGRSRRESLMYLPLVMAVGVGLCINQARAVLEALAGHKSGFERTPKYGVTKAGQNWHHVKYRFRVNWQPFVETALGIYMFWGVGVAIAGNAWLNAPFLMLFGVGFFFVGLTSIFQRNRWVLRFFEERRLEPAQKPAR